ncbi:preprotein translocase subunit SecG [Candidatus Uhrbacteria bacterium]|nr:preprotein translocase subunit SecG [Candidatus Uhrbacteria bacterium]
MHTALTLIQAIISILLIIAILLQSRGSGLSATFGGEGNVYRTKRGVEKMLFYATIGLVTLFLGISLTTILTQR